MSWETFCRHRLDLPELGFALDYSRIHFAPGFMETMQPRIAKAFADMQALEKGAIANPDEQRMVGHYWLRHSRLAPDPALAEEIETTLARIQTFAAEVHAGKIRGKAGPFTDLLVIGIGGSALGPQFVAQALGHPLTDKLRVHFLDNTDPDGFDRVFARLKKQLGQTLSVVISKSGGTPETRNGMLEAQDAYHQAGLSFAQHAVAITGRNSQLDQFAEASGWLTRFPMWDWVGGRTSETAAVGLLPAALQGIDIEQFLAGARQMDEATRLTHAASNPAALLALSWYQATNGRGEKDMVILPYKDRLELFAKYLQQLIMESLGKEKDLDGQRVNQGIAVYGNKGSTDQHAYVQQLREGIHNFFVTFIEVLRDRDTRAVEVEAGTTAGDYLQGFLLGTREALYENGRESLTLTLEVLSPATVGALIALYERAVGLYASLVHINAYHQPGVEAGKKAASGILALKKTLMATLQASPGQPFTAEQLAAAIGKPEQTELTFKLLEHLAANPAKNVKKIARQPATDSLYSHQ